MKTKNSALGLIGLRRCVDYSIEKNSELECDELKLTVKNHAEEKIYKLWKFIRVSNQNEIKILTDEFRDNIDEVVEAHFL